MSNLIIFYSLQNNWLLLLIDLDILTTILSKIAVPYLWIWLLYLVSKIQPAGYQRSSRTIYVFWPLYYLYQLLPKKKTFYCNDSKIMEFEMTDTKNSSTAYVVMYQLIT